MDIQLNFINRSNDANNSNVVIFQKNAASSPTEPAVAWKVIQNCGRGDNHPFNFPANLELSTSDAYGNETPKLTANNGQAFEVGRTESGDVLQESSTSSTSPYEVEVRNNLMTGAINASCYRSGKLLATKSGIAPGQKSSFGFEPKLHMGVAPQVTEGEVMDSEIMSQLNTEISLVGILSADIVMTGGSGLGNSSPFIFTLENINY